MSFWISKAFLTVLHLPRVTLMATDGKAACGMALLIHPDDIDAVRTCIEENHAEYVNIVPLENQLQKKRDRYC